MLKIRLLVFPRMSAYQIAKARCSKFNPLQGLMHDFLFMEQQNCPRNLTFCSRSQCCKILTTGLYQKHIYIVISTFLTSISHLLLAGGSILAINVVCSHCISNVVCCCCSSSLLAIPKFIFLDKSLYFSLKTFYL